MIAEISLHELRTRHPGFDRVAVACGVFDGVHRGHQQILAALQELATRTNATPVVLTFEPHPRTVLKPEHAPPRLTTRDQKLRLLARHGAKGVVVIPFTREFAFLSPGAFIHECLLVPNMELTGVCVGDRWRFGAYGHGDVHFLERAGEREGFDLVDVPEFRWYGKAISSTRIRHMVSHGRLQTAARLLGRPYSICGEVVPGRGVGDKELHCPTANLMLTNLLLPPAGVYAARGEIIDKNGETTGLADGIAYAGHAPTFGAHAHQSPVLEFHFFDRHDNLYGRDLEVHFLEFIRPDHKFPSVDALARQQQADIAKAREICGNRLTGC
jgi:riboflavin kinase/FMN adenylyltransferase